MSVFLKHEVVFLRFANTDICLTHFVHIANIFYEGSKKLTEKYFFLKHTGLWKCVDFQKNLKVCTFPKQLYDFINE
jgi:hypothetical protein